MVPATALGNMTASFVKAAAVTARVDPVDYGLLERKGRDMISVPQPAEQWVTHLADMNWPYTMRAAHLYTYHVLREIAPGYFGLSQKDVAGRPFNQFKNYVWSQCGQIPRYEIPVREGFEVASRRSKRATDYEESHSKPIWRGS
jgi:hypothetical protein